MINMSNGPDPFDRLREGFESPAPDSHERQKAWDRLQEVVTAAEPSKNRSLRFGVPAFAGVLALILLTVGVVGLLQPSAARAGLLEIAQASRQAAPVDIPAGSFLYIRSEHVDLALRPGVEFGLDQEYVAYLLPSSRELWTSTDQAFMQIRTKVGRPQFFSAETEDGYYTTGLDLRDAVDETILERFTDVRDPLAEVDWPTDSRSLRQAMEGYVADQGDDRPLEARLFDLAVDLLRARNPSPLLRGAIIEVLADLPLELAEVNPGNSATFAIDYGAPLQTRDTISLSDDGHLLSETSQLLEPDSSLGIPAGTDLIWTTYETPLIVPDLST